MDEGVGHPTQAAQVYWIAACEIEDAGDAAHESAITLQCVGPPTGRNCVILMGDLANSQLPIHNSQRISLGVGGWEFEVDA
jgi:hypothetical protein